MIGPTDLLHSSPAPHLTTYQVFLIYYRRVYTGPPGWSTRLTQPSEPCNTSFQRNWSTGLTVEQVGRRPTFVQRRWFTLDDTTDYPCKQASHGLFTSVERVVLVYFSAFNLASQFCQLLANYGVQMEGRSHTTGARFMKKSRIRSTNNAFDAPNMLSLIIHGLTNQRRFFFYLFLPKMCWHSFIK
jgi:hypothetical protein